MSLISQIMAQDRAPDPFEQLKQMMQFAQQLKQHRERMEAQQAQLEQRRAEGEEQRRQFELESKARAARDKAEIAAKDFQEEMALAKAKRDAQEQAEPPPHPWEPGSFPGEAPGQGFQHQPGRWPDQELPGGDVAPGQAGPGLQRLMAMLMNTAEKSTQLGEGGAGFRTAPSEVFGGGDPNALAPGTVLDPVTAEMVKGAPTPQAGEDPRVAADRLAREQAAAVQGRFDISEARRASAEERQRFKLQTDYYMGTQHQLGAIDSVVDRTTLHEFDNIDQAMKAAERAGGKGAVPYFMKQIDPFTIYPKKVKQDIDSVYVVLDFVDEVERQFEKAREMVDTQGYTFEAAWEMLGMTAVVAAASTNLPRAWGDPRPSDKDIERALKAMPTDFSANLTPELVRSKLRAIRGYATASLKGRLKSGKMRYPKGVSEQQQGADGITVGTTASGPDGPLVWNGTDWVKP